jgi:S1-C subfamily serine protease
MPPETGKHKMVSEMFFRRASAVVLAAAFCLTGQPVRADSLADTFATVHKSLALVATDTALGTAFVVQSDRSTSLLLTAAHVVGKSMHVNVYLNDDPSVAYRADVTKTDAQSDLALLTLHKGGLLPLDIATETREGTPVAVAGYPYASITFLQAVSELKPSLHEGVVSAVRLGGQIIEYSATTDHGNSGGPVFESSSGYVIGVVSFSVKGANGAYEATGIPAIQSFLHSANVGVATDYSTSATLPNVPGAFHLLFFDADQASNAAVEPILDQFDADLVQKLGPLLPGARITKVTLSDTEPTTLAQSCVDNPAVGVIVTGPSWHTQIGAFNNTISATVTANVFDCYGVPEYGSKKSKDAKPSNTNNSISQQQVISTLDDLSDQVVAEIRDEANKYNATRLENFLKYGYSIGTGERRAYFGLNPDPSGARVTYANKFGTAARAGLNTGDLVTSINGQSTVGLSHDQLTGMLFNLAVPPNTYSLEVQSADGSKATLTFEAKDIRWYLSHPAR